MYNAAQNDLFLNPTSEYGPANYWFWQRIPTRDEIDRQLEEMKKAGFRVFYIQARLAFPIDQYLSEPYLSAYRYAIEQADSHGLKAGIYDDYNWNSGHAGGLTVRGHDEYRERQLFWTSTTIFSSSFSLEISDIKTLMGDSLGGAQGRWTYEGGKPVWDQWQVVSVVGYPETLEIQEGTHLVDLSEYCSIRRIDDDRCKIEVKLPDERHLGLRITAFVTGRCMTSRHMNYLLRNATARFIEVGYEPYRKAVGDFFGSTIFCLFMDHPHAGFYIWNQLEGNIKNSLMYDDSLVEAFETEHGYPVEIAWLSFLLPISPFTARARGDFFNTYGSLARENFLGQVSGWAHKNGLKFAGHELFGFLGIWGFYGGYHVVDQRTDFGGDYFGIGRYKDISTVDAYNSNPQIDAKIGDSVARAQGNHGCMLEQYYYNIDPRFPGAIGHWNLTFDEMRAQALRHTFFGTKQFIFHGFYLTDREGTYELLASSRFDFAPGINYEPWFIQHSAFAHEIARLSAFLYSVPPLTNIAMLYPLSTFWVEETDGVFGEQSAIWNQWFLENGFGFDIVDENQLLFSKDAPGRIQAGPNSYRILVLPGVTFLRDAKIVNYIVQFVESGGVLLLSGSMPGGTIAQGMQESVRKSFEGLIKSKEGVRFFNSEQKIHESLPALMDILLPDQPRIIHPERLQKQVWSRTGKDDSGYRLALFNDSNSQQRIIFEIPSENVLPEQWDLTTGTRQDWLWYKRVEKTTQVLIDLAPRELVCLKLDLSGTRANPFHLIESSMRVLDARDRGKTSLIKMLADCPGRQEVTLSNIVQNGEKGKPKKEDPRGGRKSEKIIVDIPSLPEPLPLTEDWKLTIPGRTEKTSVKVDRGWERQGYDDYAGEGDYETTFDLVKTYPSWENWNWMLVFPDLFTSAKVFLNGKSVGILPWPPYEILLPTDLLKDSDNHLLVKVFNTAGNYYYAGSPYAVEKFPSGIVGRPFLRPVKLIQIDEHGELVES